MNSKFSMIEENTPWKIYLIKYKIQNDQKINFIQKKIIRLKKIR